MSNYTEEDRIYIVSKVKHAGKWRQLRAQNVPIISSWIEDAERGKVSDWQDLWRRCLNEASTATELVVYIEPGEVLKGSIAEIGAALANNVRITVVGDPTEQGTWWRAKGVSVVDEWNGAAPPAPPPPAPPPPSPPAPHPLTLDMRFPWLPVDDCGECPEGYVKVATAGPPVPDWLGYFADQFQPVSLMDQPPPDPQPGSDGVGDPCSLQAPEDGAFEAHLARANHGVGFRFLPPNFAKTWEELRQGVCRSNPDTTEPGKFFIDGRHQLGHPRAMPEASIPTQWAPNDEHRKIAVHEGLDIDRELEKFRDDAVAKRKKFVNWDAAFRNWLRSGASGLREANEEIDRLRRVVGTSVLRLTLLENALGDRAEWPVVEAALDADHRHMLTTTLVNAEANRMALEACAGDDLRKERDSAREERDAARAEVNRLRAKSPSVICHETGVQSCHFCDDFDCGDNMSDGAKRLKSITAERDAARTEVDRLQKRWDAMLPEWTALQNEINGSQTEVKRLHRQAERLRANLNEEGRRRSRDVAKQGTMIDQMRPVIEAVGGVWELYAGRKRGGLPPSIQHMLSTYDTYTWCVAHRPDRAFDAAESAAADNSPPEPKAPDGGSAPERVWCPQCGPVTACDEDECCLMCGATMVGLDVAKQIEADAVGRAWIIALNTARGVGGAVRPETEADFVRRLVAICVAKREQALEQAADRACKWYNFADDEDAASLRAVILGGEK